MILLLLSRISHHLLTIPIQPDSPVPPPLISPSNLLRLAKAGKSKQHKTELWDLRASVLG